MCVSNHGAQDLYQNYYCIIRSHNWKIMVRYGKDVVYHPQTGVSSGQQMRMTIEQCTYKLHIEELMQTGFCFLV